MSLFYLYAIGISPVKYQLTTGFHIFKIQPNPCGRSRRAIRLTFDLAADGSMMNPDIRDTGPE